MAETLDDIMVSFPVKRRDGIKARAEVVLAEIEELRAPRMPAERSQEQVGRKKL